MLFQPINLCWQSKSLGIDSCWTLRKFCFDFRELQQTACPALLLGVHWQSLLLHGGRLGAGINLNFHKWLTFPQVLNTCRSLPCTMCWVPLASQLGFIVGLILNNTRQNHRPLGHRPFLLALTGSGPCYFSTWDVKVWDKTTISMGECERSGTFFFFFFSSESCGENWKSLCVGGRGVLKETFKMK